MAPYLIQVSLQRSTGLPEDRVVNTFHAIPETGKSPQDLAEAVASFYNDPPVAGSGVVGDLISNVIPHGGGQGHTLKVYDLADPIPRTPVFEYADFFLGGNVTGSPLPSEVALVGSFHMHPVSGDDPRRRRGRVYIGPLDSEAITGVSDGDVRPAATAMGIVGRSLRKLLEDPDSHFGVFSRVDNILHFELVKTNWVVYVDNALDTQRRRGARATSRTFY